MFPPPPHKLASLAEIINDTIYGKHQLQPHKFSAQRKVQHFSSPPFSFYQHLLPVLPQAASSFPSSCLPATAPSLPCPTFCFLLPRWRLHAAPPLAAGRRSGVRGQEGSGPPDGEQAGPGSATDVTPAFAGGHLGGAGGGVSPPPPPYSWLPLNPPQGGRGRSQESFCTACVCPHGNRLNTSHLWNVFLSLTQQ